MPDLLRLAEDMAERGLDQLRAAYGRAEDKLMPDGYGFGVTKRTEKQESEFDQFIAENDPLMVGTLREAFSQLSMRYKPREAALKAAELVADRRKQAAQRVPAAPAVGQVPVGTVTQGIGAGHPGQDFAADKGTPVQTEMDGVPIFVDEDEKEGRMVIMQFEDGTVRDYGHLDEVFAQQFVPVKAGEVIGTVGDSGQATAPHLHVGFGRPRKVSAEGGYGDDDESDPAVQY